RYPVWKSLFHGKSNGVFGVFLGAMRLAKEQMEHRSRIQGTPQAIGVCNLLRQNYRFLAPRQRLVRITQVPQHTSSKAMAHHPSVLAIEKRIGAVLLGVVERYTLRKMCVRICCRAHPE